MEEVIKKETLNDYYKWLSNSRLTQNSLPQKEYPAKYVLEATVSDITLTSLANSLYNNEYIGWQENMKNASLLCKEKSYTHSLLKPSWNNFDLYGKIARWNKIKKALEVDDDYKEILYNKYGEENLYNMVLEMENENKVVKGKMKDEEDKSEYKLGNIKEKADLFNLLNNTLCSNCNNCPYNNNCNKIFLDVNSDNQHEYLENIKYIFIRFQPLEQELQYGLPFVDERGMQIRNILINELKLKSSEYILINLTGCNKNSSFNSYNKMYSCFDMFEIIKSYFENLKKIFVDIDIYNTKRRFGILSDNEWYTYDGIYTISTDLNNIDLMFEYITKKPRTKSDRKLLSNNIKEELKSLSFNENNIPNQQKQQELPELITIKDKLDVEFYEPTIIDTKQFFSTLDEKWTLCNVGCKDIPVFDKLGHKLPFTNKQYYVMLRKGNNKIVQYIDTKTDIYFTTKQNFENVEPISELNVVKNVSLNKRKYKMREAQENNNITNWYNTDLPYAVYTTDIIRNQLNYKEGEDKLKIWFFDIEAEPSTINVKPDDERLDGKLRLFTIFDTYEKIFYVGVRKEKEHHTDNNLEQNQINTITEYYEETEDKKGNKVINGPYKVVTFESYEEKDIFNWLIELMIQKDPDVITGWNIEGYDIPMLYVRAKTLGVPLRNKYSYFDLKTIRIEKGIKHNVICDGIMFIDYLLLYKLMHQNKRESYKLDYICEIELGASRKKNEVENGHDWMYQNKLKDYTYYNIVDVFRVFELDSLFDYFGYVTEILNMTGCTWDDIYSQTKLIDGLVFNHVKMTRNSALTMKQADTYDDRRFEGAYVLDCIPGAYSWVVDLDLTSLYPSIMINYNITKDTLTGFISEKNAEKWLYNREALEYPFDLINFENRYPIKYSIQNEEQFKNYLNGKILTMSGCMFYRPEVKKSYIAEISTKLMENRSVYKQKKKEAMLAKNVELTDKYNNIQAAIKRLNNAVYGASGASMFRLYDIYSSASITASGREITKMCCHYISRYLQKMIEMGTYDVPFDAVPFDIKDFTNVGTIEDRPSLIMGDTDSLFIHLGGLINTFLPLDASLEEKTDLCWKIVEKCQDFCNEYVIKDMLRRKDIDPNSLGKYIFNYKREFIYSKCLTSSKKHYACKTIMNNGVLVDGDIDVKGLNVIKSDFSRIGKEAGMEILLYILNDYDENNSLKCNKELEKIISKYENITNNAIKNFDPIIGKPVTMPSDVNSFKVLTGQLKGIMLFEELFGYQFKPAEKGYLYWIKDVNWAEFGMSENQMINILNKKYGNCQWFKDGTKYTIGGKKLEKPSFGEFNSIVIPMENNFDVKNKFILDDKEILKKCIYEMVQPLVNILGIKNITPEEKAKEAKKCNMIIL